MRVATVESTTFATVGYDEAQELLQLTTVQDKSETAVLDGLSPSL